MSQITPLLSRTASWLNSPGSHGGIVVSSRVRLARNVDGFAFQRKLSKVRQEELVDHLIASVTNTAAIPNPLAFKLEEIEPLERLALVERQLISRDLAGSKGPAGVFMSGDEMYSLMFNEEDHLRLQVISAGLCINANLELAVQLDRTLEHVLPWSCHEEYGYLTACPTNVGTGLRASVMLHLPALVETGEFKQVMRSLNKLHMTVRGLHGEGSEPTGHLYQISNQRALGMSEQQLVDHLNETVERIIAYEQLARQSLMHKTKLKVEDKVYRAWGLLTHARSLTSDEATDQLSWLRLGVALGILTWRNWKMLDKILLQSQPAHIQLQHSDASDVEARDHLRAELVRKWLQAPSSEAN